MKISLNHIRFYRDKYNWSGNPTQDGERVLFAKIGAQLGAIDEVINIGERYQDGTIARDDGTQLTSTTEPVIVKVVSCTQHPNADRLKVCVIDDGGVVPDVDRGQDGYVHVVCGAPNVEAGQTVVWLPPGSIVPETYDKEPFMLEARELRGVVSNGMLASPKELAISDSHDGILVVDEEIELGTSFVDAFSLRDDKVIDIENKMFTHRPDLFGMIGVARELAGIQGQKFTSPSWYSANATVDIQQETELAVHVRNEVPELVPRFTILPMGGVSVKPSPVWLQVALSRLGVRPINNIVDLTNYYMLLTGQPLHAYDYDKVKDRSGVAPMIVVRHPRENEKLKLLNGKEITPIPNAIMIATDKELIGLGGVMGGADTEVDENTTNIILEAATFDMYSIRRTSMAHGLFTDAVTRFTKGQSPLQNVAVIAKVAEDITAIAGGKIAGNLGDDNRLPKDVLARQAVHEPVRINAAFINERLGLNLNTHEITTLLENVEFLVQPDGTDIVVTAPFWRTDIEIPEDIVEEVGRLYGYDHLPLELPRRSGAPVPKDLLLTTKSKIRARLAKAGANEVLTYSFVHGGLLEKVGQNKDEAFKLSNALSPDLQYYRMSLTPSLLEKVHPNIKAGYDQFVLFEMGKAHVVGIADAEGLPAEFERVACVFAANDKAAVPYGGAAYYQAKKFVTELLAEFGLDESVKFTPLTEDEADSATTYYDSNRAATLRLGDSIIGRIGEYKASVRRALKLPAFTAGFELGVTALIREGRTASRYMALPKFPKITQDITLKVPAEVAYRELYDFVWGEIEKREMGHTLPKLAPLTIFQREGDTGHKQITFRLTMASYERTMQDAEVAKLLDAVTAAAREKFGAERA